jgi:hypothetical protein
VSAAMREAVMLLDAIANLPPPRTPAYRPRGQPGPTTIRTVAELVLEDHPGVTLEQLLNGQTRRWRVVEPRHKLWRALHAMNRYSLAGIGRACGGFDHTSILSALRATRTFAAKREAARAASLANPRGMGARGRVLHQ